MLCYAVLFMHQTAGWGMNQPVNERKEKKRENIYIYICTLHTYMIVTPIFHFWQRHYYYYDYYYYYFQILEAKGKTQKT